MSLHSMNKKILIFVFCLASCMLKAESYVCIEYIGINPYFEGIGDYTSFENLIQEHNVDFDVLEIRDSVDIDSIFSLMDCSDVAEMVSDIAPLTWPSAILYIERDENPIAVYEFGIQYYRDISERIVYKMPWRIWLILKKYVMKTSEGNLYRAIDRHVREKNVTNKCNEQIFVRTPNPYK